MRSRGLVVGIALVLAIVAAAAVILYTNKVKEDAANGGSQVQVIVAQQDIPANTDLNTIPDSAWKLVSVPTSVEVAGAVTSLDQLHDQITTGAIVTNEQIPLSRLSGGGTTANVSSIGVSKGNVGLTVKINGDAGGDGVVHAGDHVVVYANYSDWTVTAGLNIKALSSGKPLPQNFSTQSVSGPSFVATLVPNAKVLRVQNPLPDSNGLVDPGAPVILTLDLSPQDAQNVVYAQLNATVYTGLLFPGDPGTQLPPSLLPINFLLKAQGIA